MRFNTTYNEVLKEGIFSKTPPLEKIEKYFIKLNKSFDALAKEANGVENLSKGVIVGYDNFGNVTDNAYNILMAIKDFLQQNSISQEEFVNIVRFLAELKDKTDKISSVRKVSEYSVEQFKFVKRNLDYLIKLMSDD